MEVLPAIKGSTTLKANLQVASMLLDLESSTRITAASQRLRIRIACRWITMSHLAQIRGEMSCGGKGDVLCHSVAHLHSDCERQLRHFDAQEAAFASRCERKPGLEFSRSKWPSAPPSTSSRRGDRAASTLRGQTCSNGTHVW